MGMLSDRMSGGTGFGEARKDPEYYDPPREESIGTSMVTHANIKVDKKEYDSTRDKLQNMLDKMTNRNIEKLANFVVTKKVEPVYMRLVLKEQRARVLLKKLGW